MAFLITRCFRHLQLGKNLIPRQIQPTLSQTSSVTGSLGWQRCMPAMLCTRCGKGHVLATRIILPAHPHPSTVRLFHYSSPRMGLVARIKEKVGLRGKMRFKRHELQKAGVRLYLCCEEITDYDKFFNEFELEDTFNSWFRITELHVWMCLVRLASEDREGALVRNNLLKYLWEDVEKRAKKLGELAASGARKTGINVLGQEFRANLFSYDEGILSDDKVLAGAIWRTFFEMKCENPQYLETMVQYIRKQVAHLDEQQADVVVQQGLVTFLPIHGNVIQDRTNQILNEIRKRT